MMSIRALLQGWGYLAFSSPSASQPCFLYFQANRAPLVSVGWTGKLLLLETDPTILVDSFEPRDDLLYTGNMAESIPTSPVERPNLACLSV